MLRLLAIASLLAACSAPAPAPGTQPVMPAPAPATPASTTTAAPAAPAAPAVAHADPVINRIIQEGRNRSQVHQHLETLVGTFGPRLTGSHALLAAEAWARDRFASFGLEARLETWGDLPVGFDRGPWSGAMVAPEKMDLEFTTPAWTPGVFGPHRAPALAYPTTLKAARAMAASAKGAWIVEPAAAAKLDSKLRDKIDAVLDGAGAAGYVRRARDAKGELVHTFGRYQISWDQLPHRVLIYVRGDQHDDIAKRVAAGDEVELSFSIDNRFFKGPVPQHNVIADIRGTEKPDEYVIIGGHIDSWDGAGGVVDNGTGVATTLEAARLLMAAGAAPKRTIRFMLWSGEEQGLLGSSAYVKAHPELMAKISAVLVHDGGTNFLSGLAVTPEMAEQAKRVFEPVFGLNPDMPFGLYYAAELRAGGSDHTPFIRAGVPGFFWRQSGKAIYGRSHHTQYDTLDAVVPEYQQHSAMVVALAALGLANEDALLDRTNSEALATGRRLGVELDGAKITEVAKDTNASRLGLKPGDVLLQIGDVETRTTWDVVKGLRAKGDVKPIVFRRGGKRRTVTLDFGAGPNAAKVKEREARRKTRFGDIEYGKLFAGVEVPEGKYREGEDDDDEAKDKAKDAKPEGNKPAKADDK